MMTKAESILTTVTGGQTLIDWFGFAPSFHDSTIQDIQLSLPGQGVLRIAAFRMTNVVDENGYYVLDKHALVTITLDNVTLVDLKDFDICAIIDDLEITKVGEELQFSWDCSYGVYGTIRAKDARIEISPGKP